MGPFAYGSAEVMRVFTGGSSIAETTAIWSPPDSEGTEMTDAIKARIRDIPDFPKKGILFKDITPLLADGAAFQAAIEGMVQPWRGERIQKVVGIESRGFVFAAPVALALGAGLILVRKPGKLPWKVVK